MDLQGKDCLYVPQTEPALPALPVTITRLLVVGAAPPDGHLLADEVRVSPAPPSGLAVGGFFAFRVHDVWQGVFVEAGPREAQATLAARGLEDDHWCIATRRWSHYLWDNARRQVEPSRFNAGDQVLLVGSERVGTIKSVDRVEGRSVYQVWFGAGDTRSLGDESLQPFLFDDSDPSTWVRAGAGDHAALAQILTYTKLTHALTDTIYSYRSSRTSYRPYQFRPVLRLIAGGPQRLLIADEVGLGKTIEAGLIWNELAQRTDLRRVLVVCPAMLVHKWRAEMDRRFDRKLTVLDKPALREFIAQLEAGDADTPLSAVVSLEMLRSAQELEGLAAAQPRLDLVVVDEAHYLRNRGTRSYALGELLGDWADALIFLSATPLNLGQGDLFTLVHLLRPETFPDSTIFQHQIEPNRHLTAAAAMLLDSRDQPRKVAAMVRRVEDLAFSGSVTERAEYRELLAVLDRDHGLDWQEIGEARRLLLELNVLSGALTRTRKVDVPDAKAVREPRQVDVQWTLEERELYVAVLELCRAKARSTGKPPGFIMQMPLRQAASCLPATKVWLQERHGVGDEPVWNDAVDDDLVDIEDQELPDAAEEVDGNALAAVVLASARLGNVDTKFDRFREALLAARAQGMTQLMVFSFFRRTLHYLERRLAGEFRVKVMHGGVPMADRTDIIDGFRRGDFDILLVSEVGSEGLDFEFCNVLVNYDLPWNPMRVEQRIGRLDRFGQKHDKIFIYNFHVPGTIETDIYERLYARINVFHESIGELEPILRESTNQLAAIALDPQLTEEQRTRRLAEIEVAWTDRDRDLRQLKDSEGMLAGLDNLLIDGLERDLSERGRFIGGAELRSLLGSFVRQLGGNVNVLPGPEPALEIRGSDKLAARLTADGSGGGTRMGLAELKQHCYYERPFTVVFDGEAAGTGSHEFIGVRHPLVRAAVASIRDSAERPVRFATVTLPESPVTTPVLVLLALVETTGLRPQLELSAVAVSVDKHAESEEVGFALLQALTADSWGPGSHDVPLESVLGALTVAQGRIERKRFAWERARSDTNSALVEARIASRTAALELKMEQARQTLAELRGKDPRLTRMYEGRIRNLAARRDTVQAELIGRRQLAVSVQPVAVVLVVPMDRTS
jgi:superfamily II DNA or RNA helicase